MKVWIFVEGRSDVRALEALWRGWRRKLREQGRGIQLIQLDNKPKFLRKIGSRAMEKLVNDPCDLVVGLPDLYPNKGIALEYKHGNLEDLRDVQNRLVRRDLKKRGMKSTVVDSHIERFYASAMKHDMEVLLLAAHHQLESRLRVSNMPRSWRQPPEEQNQDKPPKKIVQALFSRYLRKSYRENVDSLAILRNAELRDVAEQCPTFGAMIDWIGEKTHVPGY